MAKKLRLTEPTNLDVKEREYLNKLIKDLGVILDEVTRRLDDHEVRITDLEP